MRVKRIPNAVAFIVFIGIVVTITNVLTAPAGGHLYILVGGLTATVILGVIVAAGIWLRTRLRRARGSNGDTTPGGHVWRHWRTSCDSEGHHPSLTITSREHLDDFLYRRSPRGSVRAVETWLFLCIIVIAVASRPIEVRLASLTHAVRRRHLLPAGDSSSTRPFFRASNRDHPRTHESRISANLPLRVGARSPHRTRTLTGWHLGCLGLCSGSKAYRRSRIDAPPDLDEEARARCSRPPRT